MVLASCTAGALGGPATAGAATASVTTPCQSVEALVAHSDGGVTVYDPYAEYCGGPVFDGSAIGSHLNAPIVGIATTPDNRGYWLVASDGGIFAFGDAGFYGSTGSLRLNKPIVGMAATPDGKGYWLVAADGGIFSFGDAQFHGSTGSLTLNQPVVGMAADGATGGYWLTAADGGVFAFDAPYLGSMGGTRLNAPIRFVTGTPDFGGYRMVASDGGVFDFGDAAFFGSAAAPGSAGWDALAVDVEGGNGYWLFATDDGTTCGITATPCGPPPPYGDAFIEAFGSIPSLTGASAGDITPSPIVSAASLLLS
jgi:hypothetical protein